VVEGEEVDYIRETTEFPGIAMILRVDSEVKKSGVVTGLETRHFVASLEADEASPKRLMAAVRGHWGVENGLHFIKDRWWDEDRQWSTRPGLAERLATLRDCALAALRLIPGLPDDLPIRGRADHLSRSLRKALKFIGALK
jgi:predicted transposase YbfD/YdcC